MKRPTIIKKLLKHILLNQFHQQDNHVEQREQLNLQCDILLNIQQQLQCDDQRKKKRKLSDTTISNTSNLETRPLFIPWPTTINKKRMELKSIDEKTVVKCFNKYFRHVDCRLLEEFYEYTIIGLCHVYLDAMWVKNQVLSETQRAQLANKLEEKMLKAGFPIHLAEDKWLAKYFVHSHMVDV